MNHAARFLTDAETICKQIPREKIELLADGLAQLRERGGRLFLLGVGGSAGNCSHAVNDFRKLCGIEAYSPIDNVSELTARTNDEGWDSVFAAWLETSRLDGDDAILIFSVGGATPSATSAPILSARSTSRRSAPPRCSGSSAGIPDTPRDMATWSSSSRR